MRSLLQARSAELPAGRQRVSIAKWKYPGGSEFHLNMIENLFAELKAKVPR